MDGFDRTDIEAARRLDRDQQSGLRLDLAGEDPAGASSESRHDFGELALAVARNGGDSDDLAGADIERDIAQGGEAAVVRGRHTADRQDDVAGRRWRTVERFEDAPTDHQSSE